MTRLGSSASILSRETLPPISAVPLRPDAFRKTGLSTVRANKRHLLQLRKNAELNYSSTSPARTSTIAGNVEAKPPRNKKAASEAARRKRNLYYAVLHG
jgi:hypothetical protein